MLKVNKKSENGQVMAEIRNDYKTKINENYMYNERKTKTKRKP